MRLDVFRLCGTQGLTPHLSLLSVTLAIWPFVCHHPRPQTSIRCLSAFDLGHQPLIYFLRSERILPTREVIMWVVKEEPEHHQVRDEGPIVVCESTMIFMKTSIACFRLCDGSVRADGKRQRGRCTEVTVSSASHQHSTHAAPGQSYSNSSDPFEMRVAIAGST
jgi:hypothetical protein